MRRIFVDTNVFLDVLQQREPFCIHSANVLNLGATGRLVLYTSAMSLVNCLYVMRKVVGYGQALTLVGQLRQYVHVSPVCEEEFDKALTGTPDDLEDAVQYHSALKAGCAAIITRDANGFRFARIPVYTPQEFLAHCQ